ncbi:4-azaleucine resistance transporter AzlC [Nocardioides albertanoniae]|uniref:4-azaleucine resistance transporter AzlC n=1 Tax=Nocardioides albertanoniae TaxID=1175486 RepID=A0A543A7P8_9ACTN|nr:AzlC family ABC transporter permease [Nocardioides albertanoniae]TQL68633.1 4-azaleucine resistance transporter AzlC [Nocardioides albertanoniae]
MTDQRRSFLWGLRLGVPFALVGFVLSLSFAVLARQAGFSTAQAIVTSVIVFAGSAQFAMLSVVTGGGGVPAALAAASLMNSRFLAMGIALAPSLPGGPVKRAAQGQAVVDASWALANRGDGTFDRWLLFGTTAPQYLTWTLGSVVGAVFGDALGSPDRLGLDAIYPTFFLALLIAELRDRATRWVAIGGGVVALALVPLAPPGVPVLAASAVALVGLFRRPEMTREPA